MNYHTKMRLALAKSIGCYLLLLVLIVGVVWQIVFPFSPYGRQDTTDRLYIHVLSVGQGDAILLQTGELTMLIDCGTYLEPDLLMVELRAKQVSHIDYLLFTHPHDDHTGNARALLFEFSVGKILIPDIEHSEPTLTLALEEAQKQGIPTSVFREGDFLPFGDAKIYVLSAAWDENNENNSSAVLRVSFGDSVALLMGDAEEETEERLLEKYDAAYLDCDLLKVGHHGSNTSSTAAFLAAATPQYAAVSCGLYNSYNFPHYKVVRRLEAVDATVLQTDRDGTLSFCATGDTLYYIEN